MNNFYFRAVASDGQIRTGTIHAETERLVAYELRRQGLTPVYVGRKPKNDSRSSCRLSPAAGSGTSYSSRRNSPRS